MTRFRSTSGNNSSPNNGAKFQSLKVIQWVIFFGAILRLLISAFIRHQTFFGPLFLLLMYKKYRERKKKYAKLEFFLIFYLHLYVYNNHFPTKSLCNSLVFWGTVTHLRNLANILAIFKNRNSPRFTSETFNV